MYSGNVYKASTPSLITLFSGKFQGILCQIMQTVLRIIMKWHEDHSLSTNPRKMEMVHFTRRRKLGPIKIPTLLNTVLNFSSNVKYLGVTLDAILP